MQKQTNWRGRLLTCVLAAGMLMTSVPVYSGSVAVEAASETKTTKIDFSTMKNLRITGKFKMAQEIVSLSMIQRMVKC